MILKLINILFVLYLRHQKRQICDMSMPRVLVSDQKIFPAVVVVEVEELEVQNKVLEEMVNLMLERTWDGAEELV